MPDIQWINLLIQIPLAGLVVFQTFRFLKHLETVNKNTLDFIAKQTELNREFLKDQREQMNISIARLAEEIKSNRYEIGSEIARLGVATDKLVEKTEQVVTRLVIGVTK